METNYIHNDIVITFCHNTPWIYITAVVQAKTSRMWHVEDGKQSSGAEVQLMLCWCAWLKSEGWLQTGERVVCSCTLNLSSGVRLIFISRFSICLNFFCSFLTSPIWKRWASLRKAPRWSTAKLHETLNHRTEFNSMFELQHRRSVHNMYGLWQIFEWIGRLHRVVFRWEDVSPDVDSTF